MMQFKAGLLFVVLCCAFRLTAQNGNPINYLNQKQPGMVAEIFARGILSTEALEHSSPAFSPNGTTVLWSVMKMPTYQICLLQMDFTNNQWSAPHVPAFSDTTANEVYPNFSPRGDTLYFSSNRKSDASQTNRQTMWFVTKNVGGWSPAKLLDTTSFKKDIYAHSRSENNSWYFTVGPHGTPDWNINRKDP